MDGCSGWNQAWCCIRNKQYVTIGWHHSLCFCEACFICWYVTIRCSQVRPCHWCQRQRWHHSLCFCEARFICWYVTTGCSQIRPCYWCHRQRRHNCLCLFYCWATFICCHKTRHRKFCDFSCCNFCCCWDTLGFVDKEDDHRSFIAIHSSRCFCAASDRCCHAIQFSFWRQQLHRYLRSVWI